MNGTSGFRFYLIGLPLVIGFLHGCIGVQSYPHEARAGDTVTLSLGSGEIPTRSNTTVIYTPDSDPDNPVDLTSNVQAIFRMYPDKTSTVMLDSAATGIPATAYHEPWVSFAAIDLPASMPVGTGMLHVTSTATYPPGTTGVNNVAMALKILEGTGNPFPKKYAYGGTRTGNLADLEPVPYVVVRPSLISGVLGAATFTLNVPMRKQDGSAIEEGAIEIITEELNRDMGASGVSQVQTSWHRTGDTLVINFVSPNGMYWSESRCTIVLRGSQITNPNQFSAAPTVISASYYDLNGNPVTGGLPTVEWVQ